MSVEIAARAADEPSHAVESVHGLVLRAAATDPPRALPVLLARDQREDARRLLDRGVPVLISSGCARPALERARVGIAYHGTASCAGALAFTRTIAELPQTPASIEIVYVDDTAAEYDQRGVISARRAAVIEWWLRDVLQPAPVRAVRRIGDPADELARHSEQLDLLVIGTRGRARLRRLTGSVSRALITTSGCALLIVPPVWATPPAPSGRDTVADPWDGVADQGMIPR